jgi:hypothetical protein
MPRLAIKIEAAKFIEQFGPDAYGKAEQAMREARRRRNARLAEFLGKVMLHIAASSVTASGKGAEPNGSPPT